MNETVVSLGAARAEAEDDNRLISPRELFLQLAKDQLGEEKAESAIGVWVTRNAAGEIQDVSFRRSNLTDAETLAVLEIAKFIVFQNDH